MNPILTHRKNGKQLIRCVPNGRGTGYIYLYLRCHNLWAYFPKSAHHGKVKSQGGTFHMDRLAAIYGHHTVL